MTFVKAERKKIKLKIALIGPSGSGKSYSALQLAKGIGGSTAYIDTESGRGELYADKFDYDIMELNPPFTPERFIEAIKEAENEGYKNLIIDSASHEWMGRGGCLEIVEKIQGNDFTRWAKVTPRHNAFVDAIVRANLNLIFTLRGKDEYVIEANEKGKMVPKKVGVGAEQRKGLEYECIVAFNLDLDTHSATATKDNTGLFNGVYDVISVDTGKKLKTWAESGKEDTTKILEEYKRKIMDNAKIKGLVTGKDVSKLREFADKKGIDLSKLTANSAQLLLLEIENIVIFGEDDNNKSISRIYSPQNINPNNGEMMEGVEELNYLSNSLISEGA